MRVVPVCAVVCIAAATLSASVGIPVDVGTRTKGAGQVVIATVTDVYSTFGTTPHGDRVIFTHAQLQVEEVLKGSAPASVPLTIEGGTVGDVTLRVSDMPTLRVGERGVFFIDAGADGRGRPHGRGLGIVKLDVNDRVKGSELTLGDVKKQVRAAVNGGQR